MITIEQKKEADEVILKYTSLTSNSCEDIHCAIQDRQSVLEAFKKTNVDGFFIPEIQSLTNQISYLKSKI
jgi:hypothetical protein